MADLRGDLDLSARYLDVIRALRLSPETPLPAMTAALTRAREAHARIAAGAPSQTWKAIDGEDVRHVALRLAEGIQQSEGVNTSIRVPSLRWDRWGHEYSSSLT